MNSLAENYIADNLTLFSDFLKLHKSEQEITDAIEEHYKNPLLFHQHFYLIPLNVWKEQDKSQIIKNFLASLGIQPEEYDDYLESESIAELVKKLEENYPPNIYPAFHKKIDPLFNLIKAKPLTHEVVNYFLDFLDIPEKDKKNYLDNFPTSAAELLLRLEEKYPLKNFYKIHTNIQGIKNLIATLELKGHTKNFLANIFNEFYTEKIHKNLYLQKSKASAEKEYLNEDSLDSLLTKLGNHHPHIRTRIDPLYKLVNAKKLTNELVANFLSFSQVPEEHEKHFLGKNLPKSTAELLAKLEEYYSPEYHEAEAILEDKPPSEDDTLLTKDSSQISSKTITEVNKEDPQSKQEIYKKLKPLIAIMEADEKSNKLKRSMEYFLEQVNIDKKDYPDYLEADLSLYELLLKLRRENEHSRIQLDMLIKAIENTEKSQKLRLLMVGAGIGVAVAGGLFAQIGVEGIVDLAQNLASSVMVFPIAGLVVSTALAAYTLYQNYYNPKLSFFEKLRDNAFLFIQAIFKVASRGFWLAAATVAMTPLAGILSVAAASVDVFKELFQLWRTYREWVQNPLGNLVDKITPFPPSKKELYLHETLRRQTKYSYKQHGFATGVNLLAAVALVGIAAMWSFFPPAMLVTLGCATAMAAVYITKFLVIKRNDSIIRNDLNKELSTLRADYELSKNIEETKEDSPQIMAKLLSTTEASPQPTAKVESPPKAFGKSQKKKVAMSYFWKSNAEHQEKVANTAKQVVPKEKPRQRQHA